MMKIATEEAFMTPAVADAWRKLLDAGAPGEPGFRLMWGFFMKGETSMAKGAVERLLELGTDRIGRMDAGGVDMELIFLTAPGVQVFDADTGTALAAEANDVLAEAINANPTRFAGLAAVAPQAPHRAATEMERARGLGLKGIVINSHTKGEYLDAPAYWPVLEAAEALDMPIYIHPRTPAPGLLGPIAERHFDRSLWGFQTDVGLHGLRMMVAGVFDAFPKLQIVLGHLGEGLPFWINRIDRHMGRELGSDAYPNWHCKELPGHYLANNFHITTSGHNWDPAVRFVEEVVGEDRLMFAVDDPYESPKQQVAQAAEITLKNPDKFYHLNAQRLFKLN